MHTENLYAWQHIISTDLESVVRLIETEEADYMKLLRPMVSSAIANERLIASSLLILSARAIGVRDGYEKTLHAFAAAMELIVLALDGHKNLPDDSTSATSHPLLSLGTAAGVLLGDVLYTRAFRMIVRIGHMEGLAEVARATERMVTCAALERFPVAPQRQRLVEQKTYRAEAYSACCALAAVLAGAEPFQQTMLREYGAQFGIRAAVGHGNDLNEGAGPLSHLHPILVRCFQPSGYRDALQNVAQIASSR